MTSWVLRSQQVVTPNGVVPRDIHIVDGRIVSVVPVDASCTEAMHDVGDYVVMPGLIDAHVHINEPGRTEWEGFTTATQAAAVGGITTLMDMPLNCTPVTTTVDAFQQKQVAAENQLWVHCGFYGGVVPGNVSHLEPLIDAGVFAFKAFMIHSGIDDFPQVRQDDLEAAMPVLAKHQVPLIVHAELDTTDSVTTVTMDDRKRYDAYLASRPRQWEMDAIALMIDLCRQTGCPVHIAHLSCSDALPMLQSARAEGLPMTVETCLHYLTFHAEDIPDGATHFKCAPPIREQANCDALWQGLRDGVIDFVVSDHSPCIPELKLLEQGDFMEAWGGIASLQFGLPALWTEAEKRGHAIEDVARWMSQRPAHFLGLTACKGSIQPGMDADLVVWDPKADVSISESVIRHRHTVTPYVGKTLTGKVHQTILDGSVIYDTDQLHAMSKGRHMRRSVNVIQGGCS